MPHPSDPDIVYGSCKGQFSVMNLQDRAGEELLDRRAVALRQSGERSDLPHSARVADGDVAARSGGALLRLAVRASHARQGRDVGAHFAGPDGEAGLLPGRQRRADHARRDRRGVLQHAVCDRRIAAREGRDLGRRQRRAVPRHARQRQDLDERHAEGSAARRPRAVHRRVAASQGLGVLRRRIAICSATTSPTSIAPTTTARPGRG